MKAWLVVALRTLLALALAGSVFVQAVMMPLLAEDLNNDFDADMAEVATPVIVILLLAIGTIQVTMVCVWRLLTMVRSGTVFSHAAFRYVDTTIVAIGTAALLMFALAFVLAPGEAVAPGAVLLVGGAGGLISGAALVVLVQRMLLVQAIDRDAEAQHLRTELDEVI